jgi:uncharacterized membrane protein
MAERIRARLTAAEGRKFGLTVGIAFLVLAALAAWRGKHTAPLVLSALGATFVLAALALPTRLGPVQRAWMGAAQAISKVTTPIFLAVIYFVVITPAGFVMRLVGRKPLAPPRGATTYWVTRAPKPATDNRMLEQF